MKMVLRVTYNINTLELVQGYDPAKEDGDPPFPEEAVPIEDYARTDVPGNARDIMDALRPNEQPTRKKYMLTPDLQQVILNPAFDDPIWSIPQLVMKARALKEQVIAQDVEIDDLKARVTALEEAP